MEDRKTAFAILLCIVVLLVYTEVVFAPYKTRPAPAVSGSAPGVAQTAPLTQASGGVANSSTIAPATTNQVSASGQPVVIPVGTRSPSQEELVAAGQTVIETPLIEAKISNLGARLLTFKLRRYALTLGSKDLVDLVSTIDGAPLPLGLKVGELSDEHVSYNLISTSVPAADKNTYRATGNDLVLTFEGKLSDGQVVKKSVTFKPSSYLVGVKVELPNLVVAKPIRLDWTHFVAPQEDQTINPEGFTRLTDQQKIESLALLSVVEGVTPIGKSLWAGFADKYFIAALIAGNQVADTFQGKTQNVFIHGLSSLGQTVEYLAYLGPKDYSELSLSGFQLQRSIDLGVFSFLAQPLLLAMNFFNSIIGNYGLAIVLLTLLIKTLFLPLTKASFKSMRAMQDIQPEMKALRERIKDPTQLNQEMLALYKKRGVNPMGGCLPILIQLPVFLGLYNALYGAIELRQANFALWINDLSAPESLQLFGIGVPVMVLLMGLSMFLAQATTPSAADPQQKKIMLMMPVVFTIMFVIHPFPAGLVLYWLVNNLISITQQWYLRSDKKASPFHATAIAAVGIFSFAFVLTLL